MNSLSRTLVILMTVVIAAGCSPKQLEDPNADAGKAKPEKKPAKNPFSGMVPIEVGKHEGGALYVEFSPDGKLLLSTGRDKLIKIWDLASGQLVKTFKGHTKFVAMASYSPDAKLIVSVSPDETARIWDAKTGKQLQVLKEKPPKRKLTEEEELALANLPEPQVNWAAFSPDGARVITAADDFALRVWEVKSGKLLGKYADDGCRQRRVYRRRDAAGWVTSSGCVEDGVAYLKFWDDSGNLTGTFGNENRDAHYVAYDSKASFLATADGSTFLSIYSGQGSFLKQIMVGTYHFCLAFGPGDETLLVGTDGGEIYVYKVDGWTRAGKLDLGERVGVDAMSLSPTDGSLALAARNGKILRFTQPVRLGGS